MKKHTKEYADSLAEKRYPETGMDYVESWQTAMRHGFSEGYLKAIEENAVPELIEALIGLRNEIVEIDLVEMHGDMPLRRAYNKAQNVLNKINQ